MLLAPPDATVTVSVAQIAPTTWTFSSSTPGLVSPGGDIDLKGAGFTASPVQIRFTIAPGAGITIPSPPTVIVWDQKTTSTDCASVNKDGPDPIQVDKVTYIDNYNVQIKYKNKTGSVNGKSLKCNLYSLYLYVGDGANDPTIQTLDPIVTNGDGSIKLCMDSARQVVPCIDDSRRKHHRHVRSSR